MIRGSKSRISTHTPLAGSDGFRHRFKVPDGRFQPTLPSRGVTMLLRRIIKVIRFQPTLASRGVTTLSVSKIAGYSISTHTPLAGSDVPQYYCYGYIDNFNPHSPRGE